MAPEAQNVAATDLDGDAVRLSRKLEAVFAKIQRERMQDVPILNPALSVAAIGVRPHGESWLCGACDALVHQHHAPARTPQHAEAWSRVSLGTKVEQDFPAGTFEFICGAEDELGPYRMCSLFSPVLQFANQDAALAAAEAALGALFDETLDRASEPEAQPAPQKKEACSYRRTLFLGRKAARP